MFSVQQYLLRWQASRSLAALVNMSMPSWLEPSPGKELASSWLSPPTPRQVQAAEAAHSAAVAGAEAAQAAADLLKAAELGTLSKAKAVGQAAALAAARPKVIGGKCKPRRVRQNLPFFRTFKEGLAQVKFLNQIEPEVCHVGQYCDIASRALDLLCLRYLPEP